MPQRGHQIIGRCPVYSQPSSAHSCRNSQMYSMFGSVIVKYDRSQSIHMPSRCDCRRLHRRVLGDAVAAGAHELVEAVLLDLALRVQPERLLDLDLDPQALAVEAVLEPLVAAAHRLVALEEVLQRPAPRVVHAHRVVGRDRAVDERERLAAADLLAQPLERPFALPQLEDRVLDRGVVGLLGDGAVGRHRDLGTGPLACHSGPAPSPPGAKLTETSRILRKFPQNT